MVDYKKRVDVELEELEKTVYSLPTSDLSALSALELAGCAALLHNFYNGVENVLKQLLLSMGKNIPAGGSWHKDMLMLAFETNIIDDYLFQTLTNYMAFRHYFSHAYSLNLVPDRLTPLVEEAEKTYNEFKRFAISVIESANR